jgi:hypothetical protein
MASQVMNQKVKIIKRGSRKEPEVNRPEEPSRHTTQEITSTIKLWVSEFKERRRTDEQNTRITRKVILTSATQT